MILKLFYPLIAPPLFIGYGIYRGLRELYWDALELYFPDKFD